jgi:hypothetical protein
VISVIFYILAVFSHFNAAVLAIYYLGKFIQGKFSIPNVILSFMTALMTAMIICLYPIVHIFNWHYQGLIAWLFMKPSYMLSSLPLNLLLIAVFIGPVILYLLLKNIFAEKNIRNEIPLLSTLMVFLTLYALTETNGYYLDQILTFIPVTIYLIYKLHNEIVINNIGKGIILFLIIINVSFFHDLYQKKEHMLSEVKAVLNISPASVTYVYSPTIAYYLPLMNPRIQPVYGIDYQDRTIQITSNNIDKTLIRSIPIYELTQNITYLSFVKQEGILPGFRLIEKQHVSYSSESFIWKYIKKPKSWYNDLYLYEMVRS